MRNLRAERSSERPLHIGRCTTRLNQRQRADDYDDAPGLAPKM